MEISHGKIFFSTKALKNKTSFVELKIKYTPDLNNKINKKWIIINK